MMGLKSRMAKHEEDLSNFTDFMKAMKGQESDDETSIVDVLSSQKLPQLKAEFANIQKKIDDFEQSNQAQNSTLKTEHLLELD